MTARISPDGRWLAYVSDESGRDEVYVRPFPGLGARIQVSTAGGTEPLWTANGARITYRSAGKFFAATLAAANGISVISRQALFEDKYLTASRQWQYDVDRTGKSFVVLEPIGSREMVVVLNGLESLLSAAAEIVDNADPLIVPAPPLA